ncbi:MAG: hypothetical protein MK213_08560, partial [Planctomycetes bacterium]|nr:hypothetical protein [Planctomycetota bacterium]
MQALSPLEPTRASMGRVILLSLLVPGLGHAQVGRKGEALFWFALCQGLLFLGFFLAEFTQFDFGRGFGAQGATWIFALLPEMANFGGTQVAAFFFQSAELGGLTPDAIPYRDWGHVLSGGSGLLAMVAAAH